MIDPACADQQSPQIDLQRIMEMIPHRHPFLMIDRVVDAFGGEAVSYLLANPGSLPPEQLAALRTQVEKHRSKEKPDG